MKADIWMPLYWGDYARATGHLNATMHGAYMMLTKHYWCTGEPLPDDDAVLWRVACCDSPDEWARIRPTIGKFFQIADGLWKHKRIDAELLKALERAKTAHARGVLGAKAKHSKSQSQSPSVSKDTDADAASVIFKQGLGWLMKSTGKTEGNCRAQLGKWRKEIGDEALIAVLGRGQREAPIDAMAWLEKAVAANGKGPTRKPWEKPPIDGLPAGEPWEQRVRGYKPGGFWKPNDWGPPPEQAGTRVPAHLNEWKQGAAA